MGVDAGSVYSSIRIRLTDLDNDLKGVYARLNQLEQNITKTTVPSQKNFKDMFAAVFTGQAALALAQKGFSLLTNAVKDSIQVSVDAQEMISKYDVVFSGMGDSSEEAAKRFADSFDLAGATAKEMLSNTGNLLQGMGATKKESLELSEKVNTLASDLASFTNNEGGAKSASEALTKALLGEKESMKTLGIAILDSDVNARVAKNGQDQLTGTALKLAKAQATLQLITEQSKNAIGDYARTQDSAANSQKRAAESTKELQIAIGTALNPAVTLMAGIWAKVSGALADVIGKQNELKGAEKSIEEGTATTKDRIIVLQDQIKELEKIRDTSYYTDLDGKKYASDQAKQDTESLQRMKTKLSGLISLQEAEKKAALTKSEQDDKADKKAQKALDDQEALNKKYNESRKIIVGALDSEKTEYQKIQEQIEQLQQTPWSKGELEQDRLDAINALRKKLNELFNEEVSNNDKLREDAKNRREAAQGIIDKVYSLGDAEKTTLEASRDATIEEINNSNLIQEQKNELIAKVREYYEVLKDKQASEEFKKNMLSALQTTLDIFKTAVDSSKKSTDTASDQVISAADKEIEAIKERYEKEIKAAEDAGDKKRVEILKTQEANAIAAQEQIKLDEEAKKAATEKAKETADNMISLTSNITKFVASGYTDIGALVSGVSSLIDLAFAGDTAKAEEFNAKLAELTASFTEDIQPALVVIGDLMLEIMDVASPLFELLHTLMPILQPVFDYLGLFYKVTLFPLELGLKSINNMIEAIARAMEPLINRVDDLNEAMSGSGVGKFFDSIGDELGKFGKWLGFADGGIVPGNQTSGDNIIAHVNSGEMILTRQDQSALLNLIRGGNTKNTGSVSTQNVFQIGTVISSPSGLRELQRLLDKYGTMEGKRVGQ